MSITKVRYNQLAPVPEQDDTAVDLTSTQTISGAKTFTKTVNLSPSSTTANTGGQISFHYNQNSNATSSIYEYENGKIKLVGDAAITGETILGGNASILGNLQFNGKVTNSNVYIKTPTFVRGTVNADLGSVENCFGVVDSNGKVCGRMDIVNRYVSDTDYNNKIEILVYDPKDNTVNGNRANIAVGYNQNGAYTYAPTPLTTDASTKIATTAYVKNRVTEIKNLGSSYVMNIDDFNNGAGYYACGSLSTDGTGNHISSTYNGTADIGDYRFLVEGHSAAYKCILAFSPRITDGFYYGRFWNKVWEGWYKVPAMIEGEWTPVLTGRSTKGALTYSIQSGKYCKIGHLVYIYGRVQISGITTQPVGNAGIEGLPFSSNGLFVSINVQGYGGASSSFSKATTGYWDGARQMFCIHGNSATVMGQVDHLTFSTASTAGRNIQFSSAASTNDGLGQFLFSGCYTTNS